MSLLCPFTYQSSFLIASSMKPILVEECLREEESYQREDLNETQNFILLTSRLFEPSGFGDYLREFVTTFPVTDDTISLNEV